MIVFGWREAKINIEPVSNHSCNYCDTSECLFIQVNRLYAHIFWIPFIPLHKKAYSICGHCKQLVNKNQIPPDLQKKAKKVKQASKTPWWMFTGLLAVILFVLFLSASAFFNS
ncbi:zinc-ribbon domain-containing protein [Zhouia spongiae]|uniref:Zinc-ribbon domain-containing protein n=1 Tax=Zhouia spongiae TaxID=2202721 RepID=A0ABY3YN24_9FLAO|nr:zinc-ribbon domain-containing protein [Zhouia spongiae]UNY99083.1 zinc-ribbon domain-containing protein [Zhouia spongiae]